MSSEGSALPLCVDLDGTLLDSDLFFESLFRGIRQYPWLILLLPVWLCSGKARLKRELAVRADIHVDTLPFNQSVIELAVEAKRAGRLVILVTGSHRKLADKIQEHLGIFDEVLATEGAINLTGPRKARILTERFGNGGYEYIGNDAVDLHVWKQAGAIVTVNASRRVIRQVSKLDKPSREFPITRVGIRTWIRALRIHQWAKNLLLFVPLITGHQISDPEMIALVLLAFFVFGLCASATYVINDLLDLESDRRHTTKRHRPFASGAISPRAGLIVAIALLIAGLSLSFLLPLGFVAVVVIYLVATSGYSFWLKRIASIDVLILAGLYTLRIIAGGFAAGISLSFWLLAFSMFIFLCLALVKRVAELIELKESAEEDKERVAGREYDTADIEILQVFGASSGYLAVLVLALYINSSDVTLLYRSPEILWFIGPLLLLWVTRLWLITARGYMHEDPVLFAIKDPETWIAAAATGVILAAATFVQI